MSFRRALILAIALSVPACSEADQRPRSELTIASDDAVFKSELKAVGEKTIRAILAEDVAILLSLVDDDGLALGTDNDPIPSNAFKAQLAARTGVYCEI